jgi:hypothetical protein
MTTTLIRGEKVRHINPDMVGASRGTVLATFLDLENQPVAAVQWHDGSLDVVRQRWLDRATFTRNGKQRNPL